MRLPPYFELDLTAIIEDVQIDDNQRAGTEWRR
jgi:hypothetical protein